MPMTTKGGVSEPLADGLVRVGPHRVSDDELEGAVFDVDGTLLDTMPLFYPGWPATGKMPEFDLKCSEYDFYRLAGKPLKDIVRALHLDQKGEEPTEDFIERFLKKKIAWSHSDEKDRGHPPPITCIIDISKEYKKRGVKVAIATSGLAEFVVPHLEHAGIQDLVDPELRVYATDVKSGKPAPDIFLEAARRLGVDPKKCRAFEDAESGLRSAISAGMETIDVTYHPEYPMHEGLRLAKADQVKDRDWL
eukprot:gene1113-293_t